MASSVSPVDEIQAPAPDPALQAAIQVVDPPAPPPADAPPAPPAPPVYQPEQPGGGIVDKLV